MNCIRSKVEIDYNEYYQTQCTPENHEGETNCPLALELHDKIVRNDVKGCQQILKSGFDANSILRFNHKVGAGGAERRLISRDVETRPLHVAIIYRRPSIIATLLRQGACPNVRDASGRPPLQLVLTYWPRVRCATMDSPSTLDKEGRQFHKYLLNQHARALKTLDLLLASGAKADVRCNDGRESLLHLAARYNTVESVSGLLKGGADLDSRDNNGCTALLVAVYKTYFQLASLLISAGADLHVADDLGRNVLHYACRRDRSSEADFVRSLLDEGVGVECADNNGDTPLHIAAEIGNEAAIHALLQWGACADVTNLEGQSPLFKLLNNRHVSRQVYTLELLLQSTLIPRIFDKNGRLPTALLMTDMQDLAEKLKNSCRQPASLQRAARHCVRLAIGMKNLTVRAVGSLPGPAGLKDLVLFNTDIWL